MKFSGPIRAHQHSIKTNPKATLISDAILLGVVVIMLVLLNVLVIVTYGFEPLLILSWVLLGSIGAWLIISIIQCVKNLKKKK